MPYNKKNVAPENKSQLPQSPTSSSTTNNAASKVPEFTFQYRGVAPVSALPEAEKIIDKKVEGQQNQAWVQKTEVPTVFSDINSDRKIDTALPKNESPIETSQKPIRSFVDNQSNSSTASGTNKGNYNKSNYNKDSLSSRSTQDIKPPFLEKEEYRPRQKWIDKNKENLKEAPASSNFSPKPQKAKNNRFISLAQDNNWRKNPPKEIPANISAVEKAPNNYLYIAENEKGIVKVGVTKNNPYDRVESFSQYYPDKFRLVSYFNIKNLDRLDVEMFFHEILNSQFLNINYLSRVLPSINESHKEIVEKRLNGYTELFVENKTILKNLLIFLNLIDVIDLKLYDIEEINKIKDYQLGDIRVFKKTKKDLIQKELSKLSPIKPLINNKQNLLLKNAKFFFSAVAYTDLKHLSFDITADKILFKLKSKELLITNFIYTNLAPDLTQALIKTKIYRSVHFKNLVEHITNLRKHNTRVSTQFQDRSQISAVSVEAPVAKRTYKTKAKIQSQLDAALPLKQVPYIQKEYTPEEKKEYWAKKNKEKEQSLLSEAALVPVPKRVYYKKKF